MKPFLLDMGLSPLMKTISMKQTRFVTRNQHAKRFRVSEETGVMLFNLFRENPDLYESQRGFAVPPFPEVYVEFENEGPYQNTGVLWAENQVVTMASAGTGVICNAHTVDVLEDGLLVRNERPDENLPQEYTEQDMERHAIKSAALLEILWLLMHRPGVVRATQVAGRQTVVKGKLKPVRAHSVLTIDLSAKEIPKRIEANGSRGAGVREHQVRGTWVHLKHDRSCTHAWHRIDRKPFEPDTYECPSCGTRRVWRKDHVRGEHSRGNVFHTYQVIN